MIGHIAPNPHLEVRDTGTAKGRGVFATRDYAEGEVVEASPIFEIHEDWGALPTQIQRLVYNWGYLTGGQLKPPTWGLAMGMGSLFNHSDDPNLDYTANVGLRALLFMARRAIACGEELTINYNGDVDPQQDEDWFEAVGVARAD